MTVTTPLPDGTHLIDAVGNLVTVLRTARRHGAPGYDIIDTVSPYSRFMPDWCAHPAVVGRTVCPRPRGDHHCGLAHVTAEQLAWLPRQDTE